MKYKVYAYAVDSNDFRLFQNANDWEKQIAFEGAKHYLRNHLMESLKNEFNPAIKAYTEDSIKTGIGKGFFGLLRIIFPTITFLGALYKGRDSAKNAVSFMENYMGQVDPKYEHLSDLIYNVYRHGLTHTQMPKVLEIDGKIVIWEINYNDPEHLKIAKSKNLINIPISPNRFFRDLVEALEKYINDFDDTGKNTEWLETFKRGFLEMSKVHSESELLNKSPRGVDYIRNL